MTVKLRFGLQNFLRAKMQSSQVKYISLLSNSIRKNNDFPSKNLAVNHSDPFPKNAVLSHFHLHLQKPIVSAWKKKKASGSVRSTKIMLESAYFIASKLKILPEPLDAILREFGGGNGGGGGGGGFRFGSGGFDGWGRGRSKKKMNWGFGVVSFLILGVGLWLILWKRLENDVFWGFLGLTLFGFSVNVWKRGVLDWALGFCCCAALVGLLLKEDLQKWPSFFGTIKIERKRRRKRRLF
ncbi:uncharacterized protein LOC129870248 [Solanum dulcamara]|uniref:uncharacterized protein LOC129870248 n=1 Tax=Solanum dulcamara TaxID=45834 RepID=UPI00248517C6|nr:uncharacterized protein LOC129870248 [Solanum dulcamara]